jgi:hypothetical protein
VRAAADAAAHSFEIQLQQTYAPCVTLALMVQQAPQWNDLKPLFYQLAPPLLNQVCRVQAGRIYVLGVWFLFPVHKRIAWRRTPAHLLWGIRGS